MAPTARNSTETLRWPSQRTQCGSMVLTLGEGVSSESLGGH